MCLLYNFFDKPKEKNDTFTRFLFLVSVSFLSVSFNPRTHEGCDDDFTAKKDDNIRFNPRTREGCDLGALSV